MLVRAIRPCPLPTPACLWSPVVQVSPAARSAGLRRPLPRATTPPDRYTASSARASHADTPPPAFDPLRISSWRRRRLLCPETRVGKRLVGVGMTRLTEPTTDGETGALNEGALADEGGLSHSSAFLTRLAVT